MQNLKRLNLILTYIALVDEMSRNHVDSVKAERTETIQNLWELLEKYL